MHWSSWRKKFEGHLFYLSCWKSWRCDHCFDMEKVFFFFKAISSSCNTVLYRFSQLQALHKHLSTVHKQLYLHGNFPPLLETSFFNRQGFPSKPGIIFSPRKQPEVVEIRRAWILELLEFLARYECCRNVEMMMWRIAKIKSPGNTTAVFCCPVIFLCPDAGIHKLI